MDPITAASTAWTIFNGCLQAYQIVTAALEVETEAKVWHVRMRVELVRFEVWGRTLGFLDEKTGQSREPGQLQDLQTSGLGEIMQLELAQQLIQELLQSVNAALKKYQTMAQKHGLTPETEGSKVNVKKDGEKSRRFQRMLGTANKFRKHLQYVLINREEAETILRKLAELNDALDKLLSLSQRAQNAKALSAVLTDYDKTDELDHVLAAAKTDDKHKLPEVMLATTAIKRICVKTGTLDGTKRSTPGHRAYLGLADAPDASLSGDLLGCTTPEKSDEGVLWPVQMASYHLDDNSINVIVEWRNPFPKLSGQDVEQEEFVQRRNLIVQLLHETSILPGAGDYRVLDCLGYVEKKGREASKEVPLIGFLSRLPSWANARRAPVTLHALLESAFARRDPGGIPSLRQRFSLARFLANALYQLQCSSWLHRNLSSHQILFFYDEARNRLRLDEPYLIGLQYSRPDDQYQTGKSEFRNIDDWKSLKLYLHPDHHSDPRRYRRSDDIYSLGIILFEVAFWEPVDAFWEDGESRVDAVVAQIRQTAKTELASEVGEIYRDVVVTCLEGLHREHREHPFHYAPADDQDVEEAERSTYDGRYRGEDPECGLEIDFLWQVLREIEKCKV